MLFYYKKEMDLSIYLVPGINSRISLILKHFSEESKDLLFLSIESAVYFIAGNEALNK